MIINDKKPIYKAYFGDTQIITNVGSEGTGGTTNTIDVATSGIKFSFSTFSEIPDYFDFSNVTDMYRMFSYCTSITTIPLLDTSNVTTMEKMFGGCSALTTIPKLDTSKVTDMEEMFGGCSALTTIPKLDTSNVKNMRYMFINCKSLQSLPLLECGNVTDIDNFFGSSNNTTLTFLGGFNNLKIDWSDNYGLYRLQNLRYPAVMNVINKLYDFRGNGDTTTTRTIRFNPSSIALLSDEDIAIATNKGWTIS